MNKAGGLMLKKYGKKVPIEVVELDDNSKPEDAVRLTEKLMAVDKVDLVLTPWSTGFNFAVAPVYAKYGYPQVMGTAGSDKMEEMVTKFPTMFFFLAKNADQSKALVDMMAAAKKDGKINDKVALFIVQAPFGTEVHASPWSRRWPPPGSRSPIGRSTTFKPPTSRRRSRRRRRLGRTP